MTPDAPESPRARVRRTGVCLLLLLGISLLAAGGVVLLRRALDDMVTEVQRARSLRVMTWNVGKLYLRWESRVADEDLAHVAQVIRKVAPHVVALQELRDRQQLGRLVALLGPGWRGSLAEDEYDRRASLLTRLPASFVELSTSTGRTAQSAIVRWQGRDLAVASLHLDAFAPERRRVQAEEVVSALRRLEARGHFLAGDFNMDPGVQAQKSEDQGLYAAMTKQMVDAGRYAGPTTMVSHRLDYVFYAAGGVRRAHARVLYNQRINLMDHDPLVVDFLF